MRRAHGFTLIELMVTLSVAAILLTIAVPNYQTFIQDSRLTAQINSFVTVMTLAKSEAIKRSSPVTVCPSVAGVACTGGKTWSNGWLMFADPNGDGVVDAGEEILQVGAALPGGNTLTSKNQVRVRFTADGFSSGFFDTFTLCDSRGAADARGVVLSNQGRIRRAQDSDNDGIEDVGGVALTC